MTDRSQDTDIVYSIAASPDFARDGICFAARRSGLHRSGDGGIAWGSAYEALDLDPLPATTAVAISPGFDSDRAVFAAVPGGILRSSDGGLRWLFSVLPSPPPVISVLVVSPDFVQDAIMLAGTLEDGVYRSEDRGHHWSACNFGLLDLGILCLAFSPDFASDNTVFAGTASGLYRSTNGGRAWKEVDYPTEFSPVLSLGMSPHYAQDGLVLAGTESNGLYYSQDKGKTWNRVASEVISGAVNAILVSPRAPAQPRILALAERSLLLSEDGGRTWTQWRRVLDWDQAAICISAPTGIVPGAILLVGFANGGLRREEL